MTGQNSPIFTAGLPEPCNSSSQTPASDGYNISSRIIRLQEPALSLFPPIETFLSRMTVPTLNSPSNHIACEMPPANPHLPLVDPLFCQIWSRDLPRRPSEADNLLDFYATTASLDRRSLFANLGSTISSFPDYQTYNEEVSGFKSLLFADSDDWPTNFEPNSPENLGICVSDEQRYLCAFFPQPSLQHH
jgi:hypothetical protein